MMLKLCQLPIEYMILPMGIDQAGMDGMAKDILD
jgi:hypothetical protein